MATSPQAEYSFDDQSLPHVIVVGAGFAGISAVKHLSNHAVRVTIIDRHNFHTFLPLLYQVATAGLEPSDVAYPVRTIFGHAKNVRVRHARVSSVDRSRNVVVLDEDEEMPYDQLVIATGATAAYFNIPGAKNYAMPLYTLADARRLRNRLLRALEDAEVAAEHSSVALNFVVVGGGPTGVETAGALSELVDIAIKRDGLRLDPTKIRVRLVDLAPKLLTAFPEIASTYAKRELEHKGVDVELGRSVVEVEAHAIRFSDGERLEAAAVVWAAGVTANGTLASGIDGRSGPSGRALVRPDLRLVDSENVWSIGDAAAIPLDAAYLPQLAPVAIQSGKHCAQQILRLLANELTEPFQYHDKGIMATIGRREAIAALPRGPVIRGTAGWFAWLGLHLWYLVGFRNKLRVIINWTWRYFDWPSGPRLIVADAETAE
ncbi:MAG TPA: NAD(P)/FAD-dependent oxidoreductase [Acidimicrobiales bacterium]|jgi:NADH dehydrogenase|nr:NAD(P)/FAD-dependent oxidoreductase [Acidimicrobiales bacterium]